MAGRVTTVRKEFTKNYAKMIRMKRVIFLWAFLSSGFAVTETGEASYSQALWEQFSDHESNLSEILDSAEEKLSELKIKNANEKPISGTASLDLETPRFETKKIKLPNSNETLSVVTPFVAGWAGQRQHSAWVQPHEKRAKLKIIGAHLLRSRKNVLAQQERMRTIRYVQTRTNDLPQSSIEQGLTRLGEQIDRLVTLENTLMKKMGMDVPQRPRVEKEDNNPLGLLPGCPLCQLAGSPNGLPGHTNPQNSMEVPDPNTFDSGPNP